MDQDSFERYFSSVPPEIDVEEIRRQWLALERPFMVDDWQLPLPPWCKRPYTESGEAAWEVLRRDLEALPAARSICIYVHVPFCDSKCGFCDSYSFGLGRHRHLHFREYAARIERELRLWSEQGTLGRRPVTTVHLGGGTPSFMEVESLKRVTETCAACFNTSHETEWALESTVTHLEPETLAYLHGSGFRRLHLGVQTLEDQVRARIGRRQPAEAVLQRAAQLVHMGWVMSVDLICGLPGQTLTGFLDGIRALAVVGVDGFSLYELLIFPQNRRWAEDHGLTDRDHLPNYLMFQAGASYLEALGFRKNLFNHWANSRDANLYFTYPTRDEDLLAVGAIADGVFGDYHYRHPPYGTYRRESCARGPALEGGLRREQLENEIHPLVTAILSGHVPPGMVSSLGTVPGNPHLELAEQWSELALVEPSADQGGLQLTANGSWFAGNMVSQVTTGREGGSNIGGC